MPIAKYVLFILGIWILAKGLFMLLVPAKKFKEMLGFWSKMSIIKVRIISVLVALLGIAIIYIAYIELFAA